MWDSTPTPILSRNRFIKISATFPRGQAKHRLYFATHMTDVLRLYGRNNILVCRQKVLVCVSFMCLFQSVANSGAGKCCQNAANLWEFCKILRTRDREYASAYLCIGTLNFLDELPSKYDQEPTLLSF